MSKLLAVDLDGTLFYPKQHTKCMSGKNKKFLQNWIDSGNRVVLITSRGYDFCNSLKGEIERDVDFMSCTSSQIQADGKVIKDVAIPKEQLKQILKEIEQTYFPSAMIATGKKSIYYIKVCDKMNIFLRMFYHLWWMSQRNYHESMKIDNEEFDKFLDSGEVCKVMLFYGLRKNKSKISKEINKDLRNKYTDIEFSWTAQINEITPKGCSKSEGLEKYCSYMNIDKSDVYVVGDSGNDIPMFKEFHEHSYCMKHSYPSVKKYASYVIRRVHDLDKLVLKGEQK